MTDRLTDTEKTNDNSPCLITSECHKSRRKDANIATTHCDCRPTALARSLQMQGSPLSQSAMKSTWSSEQATMSVGCFSKSDCSTIHGRSTRLRVDVLNTQMLGNPAQMTYINSSRYAAPFTSPTHYTIGNFTFLRCSNFANQQYKAESLIWAPKFWLSPNLDLIRTKLSQKRA